MSQLRSSTAVTLLRDICCEAAIALPDRPSARSCNTSFALIFRTIGILLPPCALYARREEPTNSGGPHPRHYRSPRRQPDHFAIGPQTRGKRPPVTRIFMQTLAARLVVCGQHQGGSGLWLQRVVLIRYEASHLRDSNPKNKNILIQVLCHPWKRESSSAGRRPGFEALITIGRPTIQRLFMLTLR